MGHKIYNVQNFVKGLRRDSVSPEDAVDSLYQMTNYKLKYTSGLPRLVVRNGYDVWNTEELPAPCQQIFLWTDQTRNDIHMGVCGNKWYFLTKSTTHDLIKDETATVPVDSNGGVRNLPTLVVGNRAMFATNAGWYWTDLDALYGSDKCYQVGIDKPTEPPNCEGKTFTIGVTQNLTSISGDIVLTTMDTRNIGFPFTLTTKMNIPTIALAVKGSFSAKYAGSIRIKIYTNNAGQPSTTLADDNATSIYRPVNLMTDGVFQYKNFDFPTEIELEAGTYWGVVESDSSYKTNYSSGAGGEKKFYVSVGLSVVASPTYSYYASHYNATTTTWTPHANRDAVFHFGGGVTGGIFDYVITLYNSTYKIESRPSEKARMQITKDTPITEVKYSQTVSDNQVDKFRVYRRDSTAEGPNATENDIIGEYYYVGEADIADTYVDMISGTPGAELQTFDHYRIGEEDEEDPQRRGAILVKVACFWKGRVWVAFTNVIYFSKKLEEDGASGLAGDPIPDYFPPENKIETGMPNKIIAMKPLGDDQLAIYFSNSAIWIMMGMDSNLNPPDPSEYKFVEVVTDSGLITSAGISYLKSRHSILTRSGIYIFNGTPNYEYIGEGIQSILDALSDDYLDNSVMLNLSDGLWLGTDTDGDGYIEDIYIYDLQKSVPYWRKYNYGFNIYDIAVKESGTISSTDYHYKKVLASSADDNYIYVLESGFDDNGKAIESVFETHDLRVGRWGMVYGIELMGYYPNEPPSYTIRVIDHISDYEEFGLDPYNSVDVRGHRSGLRFNSPETMRVRVTQTSIRENEVLGFKLSYNQE